MKFVTRFDRFEAGDFPMVCARSGLPATKMVPVQAFRPSIWHWFRQDLFVEVAMRLSRDRTHPWGLLPFAEGHVGGVTATCSRGDNVILRGVHADFVTAARSTQDEVG